MRMPLADPPAVDDVIYPESDDQPMAENFLQSIVIRTLVAGFERLYAGRTDIIVGGDFFWYPVQGQPAIQIKEASGQFLIDDGDTVVIGGVYTSSETVSNNRVPLLHRIPLLGYLFKNFARTIERNEMLVFVTPRIVNRSR